MPELDDWVRAPNIADNVEVYERENEALAADGRLDEGLRGIADWSGRVLLDIGCGTGFWLPRYATDAAEVIGVVAVDNDWGQGEFAELLRDATGGNADIDPVATDRWWRSQGAERVEVTGAWHCRSPEELETILRIEFPQDTVDRYLDRHPDRRAIEYGFALFVWRPSATRRRASTREQ